MIAFSRFRVAAHVEASFTRRADAAVAFFRTRPGNLSADLVRNLDEPDLWAIATAWENVGSYRRGFNGCDAKILLVPLLSEAIDEPSAYDEASEVGLNLPRER